MKKTSRLDPLTDAPDATAENPIAERITGAAFQAFMTKGYAGTSTLEIATRAKVSKRDLYANFAGKEAILLACIARRAGRMQLPNLPAPRNREMLAATLSAFGTTVLREVAHPQVVAMFRLAIAEAERAPEVAATLSATRRANRDALAALLAQATDAGILGPGEPSAMMEDFFALLWGDLLMSRLLGATSAPKPREIERRAARATEAFLKLYAETPASR